VTTQTATDRLTCQIDQENAENAERLISLLKANRSRSRCRKNGAANRTNGGWNGKGRQGETTEKGEISDFRELRTGFKSNLREGIALLKTATLELFDRGGDSN
jgi:hypothetical protein